MPVFGTLDILDTAPWTNATHEPSLSSGYENRAHHKSVRQIKSAIRNRPSGSDCTISVALRQINYC